MKKFTGIYEKFKEDLLRNKIENKTELIINITCDFCDYKDEYKCVNNVANKEERWLAVETFIQKGWNELIVPKEQGIACPVCVEKWKDGDWYVNENVDNSPGRIHIELTETLKKWIRHYTNDGVLEEVLDKNLPISDISDQEMISDKDIQLAIKLLRRM